jgi:hypothetical protein
VCIEKRIEVNSNQTKKYVMFILIIAGLLEGVLLFALFNSDSFWPFVIYGMALCYNTWMLSLVSKWLYRIINNESNPKA